MSSPHVLHLGAAHSYRDADEERVRFRERPEIRMRADGEGDIPRFVDTGTIDANDFNLFGAERLWCTARSRCNPS
ncbi:MAG: hypothetical protein HY000_05925 [Planctomycetes bacterium]|nr:hypothetical protein [Planctomycetota bacterium]